MGQEIGWVVMSRGVWRAVDSFGLNWFAFARPMWDGYMEECNDR